MLLMPRAVTAFVYALVVTSLKEIDGSLYQGGKNKTKQNNDDKLKPIASLLKRRVGGFFAP